MTMIDQRTLEYKIKERIMEVQRHTIEIAVDPYIANLDIDFVLDRTGDLFVRLTACAAEERRTVIVDVGPATIWDYIKQEYAPQWFLRKYPINYTQKTFDMRALFPEYKIPDCMGRSYIVIREME